MIKAITYLKEVEIFIPFLGLISEVVFFLFPLLLVWVLSLAFRDLGTKDEVFWIIIRLSSSMIAEWSNFFGDLPLEVLLPLEALLTVTDLTGV